MKQDKSDQNGQAVGSMVPHRGFDVFYLSLGSRMFAPMEIHLEPTKTI